MTDQTPAQRMIGDFAPKLVDLTDRVLFGDMWARPIACTGQAPLSASPATSCACQDATPRNCSSAGG